MEILFLSFLKRFWMLVMIVSCSAVKQQNKFYKKITGTDPSYSQTDTSVFLANSNNLDVPRLGFYYSDSSITGSYHDFMLKKDTSAVLFLKCPGFITQNDNTGNIFYTYPDSRLKAVLNKWGYIEFNDLNGNEERNNELNFFQKLVFATRSFSRPFFYSWWQFDSSDYNASKFGSLEKGIHDLKADRLKFLDSMAIVSPMSKTFKHQARDIISYAAIRDSLILYFGFKAVLTEENIYWGRLTQTLQTINNLKDRPGYLFDEMCQTALNLLTHKNPEARKLHSVTDFFSNLDTIRKYFDGLARDYLLFDQYRKASKAYIIEDDHFTILMNSVGDKSFRDLVIQLYNQKKAEQVSGVSEKNLLIRLDGKAGESIEDIINKNKGKLILLDFWASWCQPCREERPFLKELEQEFRDMPVAFIYISLDKEASRWKVASLVDKLDSRHSFKLINPTDAAFVKSFHIDEIPRYILFDKMGEVISSNAPSPGDPKLRRLINENLK